MSRSERDDSKVLNEENKMAAVQVTIEHDMLGRIVSISRPGKGTPERSIKSVVSAKDGHSTFITEVEEEEISKLIYSHRVDVGRKSLVSHGKY
jgi:hypothetical protein